MALWRRRRHGRAEGDLDGSFRAGTATALYRMGPVDDPASLESHAAESLLRATLRDVGRRLAAADPADDHADAEPYDAFSVAAGFVLSEPAIRTIDDADWIVWVGEGGPRTRRRQATAPGLAAPRRECLQDASIHGARWRPRLPAAALRGPRWRRAEFPPSRAVQAAVLCGGSS